MTKTQYLFTYGTLQEEDVQRALFTRKLKGNRDVLIGFQLSEEKLMGKYPVIMQTGNEKDSVTGKVYNISNLELYKADAYETQAYKRIMVKLISGLTAWTYIENSG